MMGLSLGGVATAWAAQNRSDLDLAVIISPSLGYKQIPTPLTVVAMNVYGLLPDEFVWWDPEVKGNGPPPQAYPRYSKHTLVQSLRLGFGIRASAESAAPAAKKMIVVFNPNDTSINNELTAQFVKIWQDHGANISTYEFPLELQLGHDLIDPSQPDQKIDIVYPKLIELVDQ
jgi:carboxylesterase